MTPSHVPTTSPPTPRRTTAVQVAVILCASIATYANTAANGFVWDDNDIIVNNPQNRDLASIPALFASVDRTQTGHHAAYYRPLTRLTYVLDRQAFGDGAAGYHLVNVALQALAALALYALVAAWFGDPTAGFIASLLLAVHPVNSEAVDFLSTRNTVLAALFVLASLTAYRRWRVRGGAALLAASSAAFLAGLLSKETAVMLLVLLPVLERIAPAGSGSEAPRWRFAPFAGALLAYLLLRWNALSGLVGTGLEPDRLPARLAANLYMVPRYLGLVLWPRGLSALHGVPADWAARWPVLLLAWGGIGASVFLVVRLRSPLATFGLLWFALCLLPTCGIVPIPSAQMAERYLYLPAIGLWMVAGALGSRAWALFPRWRLALAAALAAVVALLAAATVVRNRVWKEPVAFYSAMSEASPDLPLGPYSLGLAHQLAGNMPAARAAWTRAASIDPGYYDVAAKLGLAEAQAGDWAAAERWLLEALRANPGDAAAAFNLAAVEDREGKAPEAATHYQLFLELQGSGSSPAARKAQARIEALVGAPQPAR